MIGVVPWVISNSDVYDNRIGSPASDMSKLLVLVLFRYHSVSTTSGVIWTSFRLLLMGLVPLIVSSRCVELRRLTGIQLVVMLRRLVLIGIYGII